jgi:hypothetical protein
MSISMITKPSSMIISINATAKPVPAFIWIFLIEGIDAKTWQLG